MVFGVVGSIILVKNLFISNDEISELSKLPVAKSTTNLTTKDSLEPKPVAVLDPDALNKYRESFISYRKKERCRGRLGLIFIIVGFLLQAIDICLGNGLN